MPRVREYTVLHANETGCTGGAETVFLELASGLDPARFRSLAWIPEDGWLHTNLRKRGVETLLVPPKGKRDYRPLVAMARLVRKEKIDLIHSHLPDQNFYSSLVGALVDCPTVVTYHGALEGSGVRNAVKLWVTRRAAAAVVAVSEHLAEELRAAGFPAEKVECIHNGVDMERFRLFPCGHLRRELGCDRDTALIGMVANERHGKGYDVYVRAARKIADAIPKSHFLAAGEIDPGSAERLSALVHELSLQDRFSFLGFREDMPEILNDLDVFVLSSFSEGFSLATVEAMAVGKPVVVTRSGGPEEILTDGRTGCLVPPGDPNALADKVCGLLRNPGQARTLGENGRRAVAGRFSLQAMIHSYEELYERCIRPDRR